MNRFLGILFIVLSIVSSAILLSPLSVSAASIYDNAYVPTENIYLGSNRYSMSCPQVDVTDDFYNIINNDDYWLSGTDQDSFIAEWQGTENSFTITNDNGNNTSDPSLYYWSIILSYWDNDEAALYWLDDKTVATSNASGTRKTLTIKHNASCEPEITYGLDTGIVSQYPASYSPYSYFYSWIINKHEANYPTGYEGIEVRTLTEQIIIKPQPLLTVKGKLIEVNQTKILEYVLRDKNIVWQNKTGYLTYMIWKLDGNGDSVGEPIHIKEHLMENKEFSYTFDEYDTYRLAVSYSWPSVVPKPSNPEGKEIIYQPFGFEMIIDGRIYNQGWDDEACIDGYCLGNNENLVAECVKEEFPFVDPGGCIGQINSFVSMLTFRTPEDDAVGGGVFHDAVNGCRELQVLDDWLLRPDQTVCPMIPAEIRNTITPFITFAFGLMTMTFIARRQGIRSLD